MTVETTPAAVVVLCSRLDVTIEDLRSPARTHDLVQARALAAWLLWDFHNWPGTRIAEFLDRSPRQARRIIYWGRYLETRDIEGYGRLGHDVRYATAGALR